MKRTYIALTILLIFLSACTEKDSGQSRSEKQHSKPAYTSTEDLPGLKKRGIVRLLAPRFDTAEALPRDGLAVEAYQTLAEEFVRQQGLDPHWTYLERFDELIPALNRGEGDLVITNMTVTSARAKQVAFTVPIKVVDEVLVAVKPIPDLKDERHLTISVPKGTAYVETVTALTDQYRDTAGLTMQLLPSCLADNDVFEALIDGKISATVVDSDTADVLLPMYPGLHEGPIVKRYRNIAWAVRKNNEQLLLALNEFLIARHVQEAATQLALRDWPTITEKKVLRMLTLNSPASYFLWRGELMGFDYDLVKHFADEHHLQLSVVVKDNIESLFKALKNGEGDLVAASITATPERKAAGLVFSRRYLKVREQLVGAAGKPVVTDIADLAGASIAVNPQTSFFKTLKDLKEKKHVVIHIIQVPNVGTEELIHQAARGQFDYVVADSHLAQLEKTYRNDINIYWNLSKGTDIAWVLRPDQTKLLTQINRFIKKEYRGMFYNVTYRKYFESKHNIQKYRQHRITPGSPLSPYDSIVQRYAAQYGFDWRMLTAQMYQESQFNPEATSFAGAMGLMQVMPHTAEQFGFDDLFVPENAIGAGVAYSRWLQERFPGDMSIDERVYFRLAAYNAGVGHVQDARALARRLGKDPDSWFGNVENAILLLSKPQYAKRARFGYVRGSEPVRYVRRIRKRYLAYIGLTQK